MKVSAWTKKVFAPVFSSSNTPTATTTTPFHSVSNPIGHAKENGSIHSNISSSLLNAKRRMRLFGSADGSSSSIMNAIFSLNRDRSSSCPDIHQTEANGGNDEKKKNDNGDGEEEKPTTTTIYYCPPDESQLERAQTPDNTSRPVEPDHEVWYLRHIGRIPAASVSSPDVSHLHHCLHQHQYHDKECEHVRRAAHNPKQRYTHCSPSPASFPVDGFRSRADSAPSILPSHGLLESNTTTTDSSSSSPVIYSQPRISSKTLVVVTPPPPFAAPPSFQVRRSSLTNEKNDRSTSRFPRHSVDTIRRLRDSIMGMAKLGSASFSSSFHPVVSPTIHITIATKSPPSSNDALELCAIPACPHNTPVVSGALELPATSTTTSTTTTTRTTAPDPSYEQLIQMVDSLSREWSDTNVAIHGGKAPSNHTIPSLAPGPRLEPHLLFFFFLSLSTNTSNVSRRYATSPSPVTTLPTILSHYPFNHLLLNF
ncbi:hypothetical protein BGX29_000505 [Mortierella sp. GBA35]|nr:hypothetical protein BGX29_000505 [Mortierella sp. GBA35]